jgi:hypothetical protein
MGRYDTLLEEPKKTPPQEEVSPVKQTPKPPTPVLKQQRRKIESKSASKQASITASTLADNQVELVEIIRKTVKRVGKEVFFIRLTPEEKSQLGDIIYVYKRQGIKTSENEIGRIGLGLLIADYQANGEASVLALVIEALNA